MTARTSDVRWLLMLAIAVGQVSGVGGTFLRELFDGPLEHEQPASGPRG